MIRPSLAILSLLVLIVASYSAEALTPRLDEQIRQHNGDPPAGNVCRSFRVCTRTKDFTWATVQLFVALEPLFDKLQLPGPVNNHIKMSRLDAGACAQDGCCCSTPVEVEFNVPIGMANKIADFLRNQQLSLKDLTCATELKECSTSVGGRRLLSEPADDENDDDVLYKSSPSVAELVPRHQAHGWSEYSLAVVASTQAEEGMYGGYGYGYGYEPTGGYPGGYGSDGGEGQYGSYGYGYYTMQDALGRPASRSLISTSTASPSSTSIINQAQAASARPASGAVRPAARQPGTCYCAFDARSATWDLRDASCRAALLSRCDSDGSLLECAMVEALYSAMQTPGAAAPHVADVSMFLFVDCPPAPPCGCQAAMSGSDAATKPQCCSILKAHCQVPFSGLDCAHVAAFCTSSGPADATIAGYVAVKTHSADCSSAQTVAYQVQTPAAMQPLAQDIEGQIEALLLQQQAAERAAAAARRRHLAAGFTIGVTLVAMCVAVTAAVVGAMALTRHLQQMQYTQPILGDLYS